MTPRESYDLQYRLEQFRQRDKERVFQTYLYNLRQNCPPPPTRRRSPSLLNNLLGDG